MNTLPSTILARSASDKTDDWPFWYVAESREGLNITVKIGKELGFEWTPGAVFAPRWLAEHMADAWNAWSSRDGR